MEISGVCVCVCAHFSRLSEATELDSEAGRVRDPEPRQGQKEIAKRLTTPSPHSQVLASQGAWWASQIWGWLSWGLGWGGGGENPLDIPQPIPEIDFKGTIQFVLIERRIFVCSLMIFWAQREIDISNGLQGWTPR